MAISRWLATLSLLLAVPLSILAALEGYSRGFYGYAVVPFAFGAIVVAVFGLLLLVVLPKLDERGW